MWGPRTLLGPRDIIRFFEVYLKKSQYKLLFAAVILLYILALK